MDQESSIGSLRRMLEIYSPSLKEAELTAFLEEEFGKLNFKNIRKDKAGNIYAEIGLGSPTLLLCGHLDTVPGWYRPRIENNRIYGRGAVDAKSAFAAMISAASCFRQDHIRGKVIIAGVVDEEGNARGIRQLLREGLKVDYAIFGEPSGVKNITFAYKGRLKLKIVCKTVSGHVGAQHLLHNALEKSFELWNQIKSFCQKHESHLGVFYSLTPCLIGLKSRRTHGGIPDVSNMDIDLRLPPTLRCEETLRMLDSVVESFQRENPGISVTMRTADKVQPFVASRETLLMKMLKEAVQEVTGEQAKFLRKTGTGDMNIFGDETRIPVATYGPGDAQLSHSADEYLDISEYLAIIDVYKRAIEKIFPKE